MTNKELSILVDEILLKVKLLSDVLNDRQEQKSSGGMFGSVDKSSVLFEVEEGVAFLISGEVQNDDEDTIY